MNLKHQLELKDEEQMQESKEKAITTPTSRKNTRSRCECQQHRTRHSKNQSKKTSTLRCTGNAFLKAEFQPIPALIAGCGLQFNAAKVESLTGDVPAYITSTANNMLKQLNQETLLQSSSNLDVDCLAAYNAITDLLNNDQQIIFDFYKNQYSIFIRYSYWKDFPSDVLFYLPIGALENMRPETAGLFKQFIAYYAKTQNICFATNYDYYMDVIDNISNCDEDVDDEEISNEFLEACKLYQANGIALTTFEELKKMSVSYKSLKKAIFANLKEAGDDEKLLNQMLKGIELLKTDSIMNYNVVFEDSVPFADLFTIIWKNDYLTTDVVNYINCSLESTNEFPMPLNNQVITPNCTNVPPKNTYPVEFANWYFDLYDILEKYE